MASSLHDPRYKRVIQLLIRAREDAGLTQRDLAKSLGKPPSYVGKVESRQRRIDIVELIDWLAAMGANVGAFLKSIASEVGKRH